MTKQIFEMEKVWAEDDSPYFVYLVKGWLLHITNVRNIVLHLLDNVPDHIRVCSVTYTIPKNGVEIVFGMTDSSR